MISYTGLSPQLIVWSHLTFTNWGPLDILAVLVIYFRPTLGDNTEASGVDFCGKSSYPSVQSYSRVVMNESYKQLSDDHDEPG